MAVYTHFLPRDTIALTQNAYINQHKAISNISIKCLEFVRVTRKVDVQHVLTGGAVSIWKYFVDGYYE